MKYLLTTFGLLIGLSTILSCSNSPKPIVYGDDGCQFCKMTIVDKIHGAELITEKGKIFKFDATECMLNFVADVNGIEVASFLTNHYETPSALISANEATFLISNKLPSPMGAYLTAFKESVVAKRIKAEKGGQLYTWETLKRHLEQ